MAGRSAWHRDSEGRIYACDPARHAVLRWTPERGRSGRLDERDGRSADELAELGRLRRRMARTTSPTPVAGRLAMGASTSSARDAPSVLTSESVDFPNGLAVTPDGRELWVLESTPGRLVAFDLRSDGSAGPRRVLADLPGHRARRHRLRRRRLDPHRLLPTRRRAAAGTRRRAWRSWPRTPRARSWRHPPTAPSSGPALDTIAVPNIGRWHVTRFRVPGLVGEPLFYPTPGQLGG